MSFHVLNGLSALSLFTEVGFCDCLLWLCQVSNTVSGGAVEQLMCRRVLAITLKGAQAVAVRLFVPFSSLQPVFSSARQDHPTGCSYTLDKLTKTPPEEVVLNKSPQFLKYGISAKLWPYKFTFSAYI